MASSSTSVSHGPLGQRMVELLHATLTPTYVALENESSKHGGGATTESHFKLLIVSPQFDGKSLLERHRMVNDAVKDGATNIPVHALSIKAQTPAQYQATGAVMQSTPNCQGGDGGTH